MLKRDLLNNQYSCLNKCLEDQETFLLIEADPVMPLTIMAWILLRVGLGHNKVDDQAITEATKLAMDLFGKANGCQQNLDVALGLEEITNIREGIENTFHSVLRKETISRLFPNNYKVQVQKDLYDTVKVINLVRDADEDGVVSLLGNIVSKPDGTLYWHERYDGREYNTVDVNELAVVEYFRAAFYESIDDFSYFLYQGKLFCRVSASTAFRVGNVDQREHFIKNALCSEGMKAFKSINGCIYQYQWKDGVPKLRKWRPDTFKFYGRWEPNDDDLMGKILTPCPFPGIYWDKVEKGDKRIVEGIPLVKEIDNYFQTTMQAR